MYFQANKPEKRSCLAYLEVSKKEPFMFCRPKNSMKSKCYVFSDYKQRNKMSLVFLGGKLQEDSYG